MFVPGRWVEAFVNSLEAKGGEADDGLNALMVIVPWVKSLSGAVFGSSAAEKLEKLIRQAAVNAGMTKDSPSLEVTIRFLALMVKRNCFSHIDSIIDEMKKFLDKKNGVVRAQVEYVFLPDVAGLKEALGKLSSAARVELEWQSKPELIGGYRLRVGDEIIDASIRSQLRKMESSLVSGDGGN